MSQFFSWLLCFYPFHPLFYLLNSFCASFIPITSITSCNIPCVCSDWNFDLVLFFYWLNACGQIPVRHIKFTDHIHAYNSLLNMGMIRYKKTPPHFLLNQLTSITKKHYFLKRYSCCCLSMITSIMNFALIISTYATSSSRLHILIFEINILKIEICLTITNKRKYDEKNLPSLCWIKKWPI